MWKIKNKGREGGTIHFVLRSLWMIVMKKMPGDKLSLENYLTTKMRRNWDET